MATNNQKSANSPSVVPESAFLKLSPLRRQILLDHVKRMPPTEMAKKYVNHLVPRSSGPKKQRLKQARGRIRHLMMTQAFRDALWDYSLTGLDLATPEIVAGVARKGSAGDVQAARLAFELTGRHAPNSDIQPAQVQIVIGNIPRPALNGGMEASVPAEFVDADAELVDEDEDAV